MKNKDFIKCISEIMNATIFDWDFDFGFPIKSLYDSENLIFTISIHLMDFESKIFISTSCRDNYLSQFKVIENELSQKKSKVLHEIDVLHESDDLGLFFRTVNKINHVGVYEIENDSSEILDEEER